MPTQMLTFSEINSKDNSLIDLVYHLLVASFLKQ